VSHKYILHLATSELEIDTEGESFRMGELIQFADQPLIYRVHDVKHILDIGLEGRHPQKLSFLYTEIWLEPISDPQTLNADELFNQFDPDGPTIGDTIPPGSPQPGVNTAQVIKRMAQQPNSTRMLPPSP